MDLIGAYPDSLTKADLAEKAGTSTTSSAFSYNVSNLRSLGLIDYPEQGRVCGTEVLFPPGLS